MDFFDAAQLEDPSPENTLCLIAMRAFTRAVPPSAPAEDCGQAVADAINAVIDAFRANPELRKEFLGV